MTLALFCPTKMELEPLKQAAKGYGIVCQTCGVGPAMTAYRVTKFLEKQGASCIILAGIGGAYSNRILRAQKAFLAKKEVFADLGRCSRTGIESIEIDGSALETSFDLIDEGAPFWELLNASSLLECVSMATVSCSSGSREHAEMISSLYDAEIENMEGAAVALVCKAYHVDFVELRSVSNLAGDADRDNWDIRGALDLLNRGFQEAIQIIEEIYRPKI